MPKKLLIINLILLAIAAASVLFIVRQFTAPMAMPLASRGRPAPAGTATGRGQDGSRPPAGAYGVVASKNLFSPTRTEAPVTQTTAAAAAMKPNLYGVVLREGAPIAYLEDPTTKRVSGYRIGDAVGGGTVQAINADSVTINRPDGKLDVRLRDPSKPRPAAGPATAGVPLTPGAQPAGTQPGLPGVIPPAMPPIVPTIPGQVPGQPGVVPPAVAPSAPPIIPGRRPLPPNLLRRLPQAQPADAPQQ
ncbi:MAG: hypothetical protein E6K82_14970 [Candidatus Rokuibacteriota bacterium]|nr:MAG: hypothetical protein E6K82_14970 [Candidatus Rokubacteria bacterium]